MDKVADIIDQASRQKRPVKQPTFSNLTLPPEYDHLNLVTRLWLQSRIIKPKEWAEKEKEREKRREEREKERQRRKEKQALEEGSTDAAATTGEKDPVDRANGASTPASEASSSSSSSDSTDATSVDDSDERPLTSLARPSDGPLFRAAGNPRPKTVAEIWLWLDLCRELSPYLTKGVRKLHPIRLFIYLLEQVSDRLHHTVK